MIRADGTIVILTGAGVSAESGIATFREAGGLWEQYRIEDVATPGAFARNPELVRNFYNERRAQLVSGKVDPNPAHFALAALENQWAGSVTLVTQNVDNLHERAGSSNLIHMHGELLKVRCRITGRVFECRDNIEAGTECSCCGRSGTLRPHVVWFGEMPLQMDSITRALGECDLFIAIGTSGETYPASGFAGLARQSGAHTVELNLESTRLSEGFDQIVQGCAAESVPQFVKSLIDSQLRP